jgi:glycosyltransferase involved in cell wall biosynthesis
MNFSITDTKKVLVLMPYYNRPKEVLRALESLSKQSYKNWALAFIDDGSDDPGEKVVRSYLSERDLKKVFFYNTNDTKEIKRQRVLDNPDMNGASDKNAGHFFVPFLNLAINEIEHDIAFFLCDDDFLDINYLRNLVNYYNNHEDAAYSYCSVILFEFKDNKMYFSDEDNRFYFNIPLMPYFNLDGSQVSWTKQCYADGCRFPEFLHVYWDAEWFKVLQEKYGKCDFNKIMGQYKSFDSQAFYY